MFDLATLPLIFARVLSLCWTAPIFATPGLGPRCRLMLAGWLTLAIAPIVSPRLVAPGDVSAWAMTLLSEAAIGAVLGISAALIVAGARQAGEIVGAQAGLSASALFDPEVGEEMTPLGHLYGFLAMVVFLSLDGPLRVVRSLLESYEAWPVGGAVFTFETAQSLFGRVGDSLALALRAAAPTAAALTMAGIALALISRAAPSLPFTALALPIRSALGLFLALVGLVALVATISAAWGDWPSGFFAGL